MAKLDLKKELKHLYTSSASSVAIVDVPPLNFLMIDGSGDPNTSQDYKSCGSKQPGGGAALHRLFVAVVESCG